LNKKIEESLKKKIEIVKKQEKDKMVVQKEELENKFKLIELRKMKSFDNKDLKSILNSSSKQEMDNKLYQSMGMIQKLNENRREDAKRNSERENNERIESVVLKLEEAERRMKERKLAKEKNLIFNSELTMLKHEGNKYNRKKLNNIIDAEMEMKFKLIKQKEEKIDQYKKHKTEMSQYKRAINDEMMRRKREVLDNFERLCKYSSRISPEEIERLFPGDKEIKEKIMLLKMSSNVV